MEFGHIARKINRYAPNFPVSKALYASDNLKLESTQRVKLRYTILTILLMVVLKEVISKNNTLVIRC